MTKKPFVLLVDDDLKQEAFALLLQSNGVDARHVTPGDLVEKDIRRADLVLIDEFLDDWPERDRLRDSPGLYVRDGLALSAVLRAHLERRGLYPDDHPGPKRPVPTSTALVLRTGHLDVLAAGTPCFIRPMAVAGRHDLEWVIEKGGDSTEASSVAELTRAAAALPAPDQWCNPAEPTAQMKWLAFPEDESWTRDARAQIELCRPPWAVISAKSAGRRWLSWFLQRILPFPTFLVDDQHAAAYLGLKPSALDALMSGPDVVVASMLQGAVYKGHLSSLVGRRWWRAGITAIRRHALGSAAGCSAIDVGESLIKAHGSKLEVLGLYRPVFQIDADYRIIPEPIEMTKAVRLQPDGWPSYADTPWLALDLISGEPELANLMVIDDREDLVATISNEPTDDEITSVES